MFTSNQIDVGIICVTTTLVCLNTIVVHLCFCVLKNFKYVLQRLFKHQDFREYLYRTLNLLVRNIV